MKNKIPYLLGKANKYVFVFPSGSPAADKIKQDFRTQNSYRIFFTPMAVASWQSAVEVLEKNAIVRKNDNHYSIIDMGKLQELMTKQTRWQDLPNNDSFRVGRKVLIKSTNIASSNSAAMYLSLVSYLANGKSVVENDSQIAKVLHQVTPLFSRQGYIRPEMVLLYPEPTIFTQHILLSMNDKGSKLGNALTTDPDLQNLAIKYGFRSNDPKMATAFQQSLTDHKLTYVPSSFNEVIDPPSYEVLEKMIGQIEQSIK